jgi:5-methylcytosine-specific restriction enzyme subunit McrC
MKQRLIRVFEHEKLTIHPDDQERFLYPIELTRLFDYNDLNNNIYFTGIRDGIKFSNYVGVIQIGGLTLEILPKADRKHHQEKKDYDAWQNVLLRMLATCDHVNVHSVSEASLSRRYHSLLDLYFILYLDELSRLIHQGLIKKYRNTHGNVAALKGRIIFPKNLQHNLIHKERIYTDHQLYDYEHLLNQVLLKGLSVLSIVSQNPLITDRIHRVKLDFPEIREIPITRFHFDKLKINRKSEPYRRALDIARMIILNFRPDIISGNENMLALLFDMNKLWEEYVYRMLLKQTGPDVSVSFQNSKKFWENKNIRPDLVVAHTNSFGDTERYIIDTKWKIIDAQHPSDDDLKQMFAYNAYWEADKSMLLYPRTHNQPEKFGVFHKGIPEQSRCKLGFANVLNENGGINLEIGDEILEKLLSD